MPKEFLCGLGRKISSGRLLYGVCYLLYVGWMVQLSVDNFGMVHRQYQRAGRRLQPARIEAVARNELMAQCREATTGARTLQRPKIHVGSGSGRVPLSRRGKKRFTNGCSPNGGSPGVNYCFSIFLSAFFSCPAAASSLSADIFSSLAVQKSTNRQIKRRICPGPGGQHRCSWR